MKSKLTDFDVKALKPKAQRYQVADGNGLCLIITPTGGKWWRYRYRLDGKPNTQSLGTYPEISLADARKARDTARALVKQGIDPNADRKRARRQAIIDAGLTFEALANDWLKIKARTLAPRTLAKITNGFTVNVFPDIGHMQIKSILYADVRAVLLKMQARDALVLMHKTRTWIARVFDFAVNEGLIEASPITKKDERLHTNKEQQYPHLQSMADAGKLLRGFDAGRNGIEAKTCAMLTLHLAQRPSELRRAKWCEFDLEAGLWTLPLERSKTRGHMDKPHTVPLSAQAIDALLTLKQYAHGEYCFPYNTDAPLSEATIRKIFRTAFPDYHVVPHGCRHFFSTQANECGLWRGEVIEAFLQHKDGNAIRAVYNKAQYDSERAKLAQWWSDQLDTAKRGGEVVQFVGRK